MCPNFFCKMHVFARYLRKNRKKFAKRKIEKSETLQTWRPFFSKTARFWEKFISTKAVEREISDHQYAFRFSPACTIREIFVKNKQNFWALKGQLAGQKFCAKSTYLFLYTHSNSHKNFTPIDSVWKELSCQKASKKIDQSKLSKLEGNFSQFKLSFKWRKLSFERTNSQKSLYSSFWSSNKHTVKISTWSVKLQWSYRVRKPAKKNLLRTSAGCNSGRKSAKNEMSKWSEVKTKAFWL